MIMKKLWTIVLFTLFLNSIVNAQINEGIKAEEYAANGKYKQALAEIEKAIALDGQIQTFFLLKAEYQLAMEDYEGAMQTYTDGIAAMPDSSTLYDGRGVILTAFGLHEEAIEDFSIGYRKAKELDEKAHFLMNRGGAKIKVRDFEGAYDDLKKAYAMDSSNLNIMNNLAAVCDEVGKPEENLEILKKIIDLDETYIPAIVNLGFKYQILGRHKEALVYFDKAVALDPDGPLGYSNRSFSKLKLGDTKGAMADINKSIKLMPSNSWAYKIRAMIYLEQGKIKKACEDLQTALQWGYTAQYGDEVQELLDANCK
jgi:tetratricopeptide (TPR) repeat protein